MKIIISVLVSLFLTTALWAQPPFAALQFSPEKPRQNQELSFDYNQAYSSLIRKSPIKVAVYQFTGSGLQVLEPRMEKKGDHYTAKISIDSNTNAIAFLFTSKGDKDINADKGYIIPVYNKSGQPVPEYYSTRSNIYAGWGESLLGLQNNSSKAFSFLNDAIQNNPELKENITVAGAYLNLLNREKKKEAEPVIIKFLQEAKGAAWQSEKGYALKNQWYSRLKMKEEADHLMAEMKEKFPDGDWKKNETLRAIATEKDKNKKIEQIENFAKDYPAFAKDKNVTSYLQTLLANGYAADKNWDAFFKAANKMAPAERASLYNNIAWNLAEKNESMQEAKKMAYDATTWAKNEMTKPSEEKPGSFTQDQWKKNRERNYAMYADSYAFILYQLGDYKAGLPYAKEAATINEFKDAELNERYALLAQKVLPAPVATKLIEGFIINDNATAKTKEALKELYTQQNKSDAGFDAYYEKLAAEAKIKRREEILKSQLDETAPKFALKDFDGNEVSLASLKGKVVIVDFWATWCGPCIASMPAMKKAQDKYKGNDNVKFVFIDTWETVEDKKKNAMEFMQNKGYDFHVLLDTEDKVVSEFGVTGIPTKFVIDGNGKIRFKSVGYSGNLDGLVDELDTMIEIASK